MPRSKRRRASSASIWSPTAATSPTNARSARRVLPICKPWTFCAAATCWPTFRRSSARSISCSARATDERAPPRREAAAELYLYAGEFGLGESADGQISGRPPAVRRDPGPVAGAGAIGRLVAAEGDRGDRGTARHGANPRARSRDLLHHVQ